MEKLSLEEVVRIVRLRTIRTWCFVLGAAFLIFALINSAPQNSNPKIMANSAFVLFSENGDLAWLVLPLFVIGIVLLLTGLLLYWKLKNIDE